MEITYTFNKDNVPSKMNTQQKALFESLKDLEPCKKEDILKALEEKGLLVTKQDPWLIFKYYQPGFIKCGFVELNKVTKPKEERVSKKNVTEVVVRDQSGFPTGETKSEPTWDDVPDEAEVEHAE